MAELVRLADAEMVSIRCAPDALPIADRVLGLVCPRAANRFAGNSALTIAWVGPDHWLVVVEPSARPVMRDLEAAFAREHAAVVDVSGNRVRFRLSGEGARARLAGAVSLDLDPPRFEAGHCAGTVVARTQALVLQRDASPTYELLPRRSFASYLEAWFGDAFTPAARPSRRG